MWQVIGVWQVTGCRVRLPSTKPWDRRCAAPSTSCSHAPTPSTCCSHVDHLVGVEEQVQRRRLLGVLRLQPALRQPQHVEGAAGQREQLQREVGSWSCRVCVTAAAGSQAWPLGIHLPFPGDCTTGDCTQRTSIAK